MKEKMIGMTYEEEEVVRRGIDAQYNRFFWRSGIYFFLAMAVVYYCFNPGISREGAIVILIFGFLFRGTHYIYGVFPRMEREAIRRENERRAREESANNS